VVNEFGNITYFAKAVASPPGASIELSNSTGGRGAWTYGALSSSQSTAVGDILIARHLSAERNKNAEFPRSTARSIAAILFLFPILILGCQHKPDPYLKDNVVGNWEEVHGTKETLQFSADGTLIMNSPTEHHQCHYDFPEAGKIRIDCSPAGSPPSPQLWKISITPEDKLLIGDAPDVGTYERK